ncbi:hypothetical protein J2S21_002806 [Peribacillus cavernae]|nr:hypothetical protein [Peribacillus cavernae]
MACRDNCGSWLESAIHNQILRLDQFINGRSWCGNNRIPGSENQHVKRIFPFYKKIKADIKNARLYFVSNYASFEASISKEIVILSPIRTPPVSSAAL